MSELLLINGPNLNLLGRREPHIYGSMTLADINKKLKALARELKVDLVFFQSNHEGALIDRIHEKDFDAAIVNAGSLTHTSVALRDALLADPRMLP